MSDLIERQAAIDALIEWYGCEPSDIGAFEDIIEKMPSAQPERKTGRWLINSDGYYPYCSECRTEPDSGNMTNFCPNCGADMRGEQDEKTD